MWFNLVPNYKPSMTSKALYLPIFSIALTACGSSALLKNPDAFSVKCEPKILERKGDSVSFELSATIPAKIFDKKAQVLVKPYLTAGQKRIDLPELLLKGEKIEGEGETVNFEKGGKIKYSGSFAFQEGMEQSELMAEPTLVWKKKKHSLKARKLAPGVIVSSELAENLRPWKSIPIQPIDSLTEHKATIFFLKDQAEFRSTEKKRKEVDALVKMLKGQVDIRDVQLRAFASPDGELDRNSSLADERAENVNQFVYEILKKKKVNKADEDGFIKDVKTAEDWVGLAQLVAQKEWKGKSMTEAILATTVNEDEKEKLLRENKENFEYLANQILPQLRRTEVVIRTSPLEKGLSELVDQATKAPSKLTEAELIKAYNFTQNPPLKSGIAAYLGMRYPNNAQYLHNSGVAFMQLSPPNINMAINAFEKAANLDKNSALSLEHWGMALLESGKTEEGLKKLIAANQQNGELGASAIAPLLQLGRYEEALTIARSTKCTFNKALAEILNMQLNVAAETIQCGEKTAPFFYLRAIMAARKGDTELLGTSLVRAISQDSRWREKARSDAEFSLYRDQEFFKVATR